MSSSSKLFTIILFSLTFALILQTSFGAQNLFVCDRSESFTSHSPYGSYLKTLSNSLIHNTPPTGFSVSIAGNYQNQQGVYGLALCRGDVSTSECKTCVSEAIKEIRTRCPYQKGAVIWDEYCFLKYVDANFFGYIDEANMFCKRNGVKVKDPSTFNYKTKELLSQLAQKASVNPKLYATGELKLEGSKKLYGLAQCTRDLSSSDCKKCLDDAINQTLNCWEGAEGGIAGNGSCNFRYDIVKFFK